MRNRSRGLIRILLIASVALVACGSVVFGLMLLNDYPSIVDSIGPAAPDLNPIQRSLLGLYLFGNASLLDLPSGNLTAQVEIVVEEGQSAASVLEQLHSSGVVHNELLLRYFLRYRGMDRQIETGRYQLSGAMSPREIAQTLQSALPSQTALIIREGWRWEQISDELEIIHTEISTDAFRELITSIPPGYVFSNVIPPEGTLEGFLFPDTYLVEPETSAEEIVNQILVNFESKLTPEMLEGFNTRDLNLYQAVTLASIIEREAVVPEEQSTIASVFLNRLALGMRLDADPTIQYALGRQSDGNWWKAPLTYEDLEIVSPYNTYLFEGLPPGPIANPGLGALQAVAFPEETPYLYFRATCDESGRHIFSVTFEEHLSHECP